jgi:hypothetical protein
VGTPFRASTERGGVGGSAVHFAFCFLFCHWCSATPIAGDARRVDRSGLLNASFPFDDAQCDCSKAGEATSIRLR